MATSTGFFDRPLIPNVPNVEPSGWDALRGLLLQQIFGNAANPYGMSSSWNGSLAGNPFLPSGGRGMFNPFTGGYGSSPGSYQGQNSWGSSGSTGAPPSPSGGSGGPSRPGTRVVPFRSYDAAPATAAGPAPSSFQNYLAAMFGIPSNPSAGYQTGSGNQIQVHPLPYTPGGAWSQGSSGWSLGGASSGPPPPPATSGGPTRPPTQTVAPRAGQAPSTNAPPADQFPGGATNSPPASPPPGGTQPPAGGGGGGADRGGLSMTPEMPSPSEYAFPGRRDNFWQVDGEMYDGRIPFPNEWSPQPDGEYAFDAAPANPNQDNQGAVNVGGPMYPWVTPYTGQFTAPMSEAQQQGLSGMQNFVGGGGGLGTAEGYVNDLLSGKYIGSGNPFIQQVQEGQQTLKDYQDQQALKRIASSMAAGGNALSGARMSANQNYQNLSDANMLSQMGNLRLQDLLAERGFQNQGVGMAGQLAGQQMNQYGELMNAGGLPQQLQQHDLNAQYQDWLRQIQAMQGQYQYGNQQAQSLLHGGGYTGSQMPNYGQSDAAGWASLISMLFGGGGSGGIGNSIGGQAISGIGSLISQLFGGGAGGGSGTGGTGAGTGDFGYGDIPQLSQGDQNFLQNGFGNDYTYDPYSPNNPLFDPNNFADGEPVFDGGAHTGRHGNRQTTIHPGIGPGQHQAGPARGISFFGNQHAAPVKQMPPLFPAPPRWAGPTTVAPRNPVASPVMKTQPMSPAPQMPAPISRPRPRPMALPVQ